MSIQLLSKSLSTEIDIDSFTRLVLIQLANSCDNEGNIDVCLYDLVLFTAGKAKQVQSALKKLRRLGIIEINRGDRYARSRTWLSAVLFPESKDLLEDQ